MALDPYDIRLADPFKDFDANTALDYALIKGINQLTPQPYIPFWHHTFIMGTTMFVTYMSHEMAHIHVGRLYGDTYAQFPFYTKEFLYVPTVEQYTQETAAGPNQQELNARYYWRRTLQDTDFDRSFGYLLNKLTSPVYFLFTKDIQYWDRGFKPPYDDYNVFGDHNFYVELLNRQGLPLTKSQLLSELVFSNLLTVSNWEHLAYWWTNLAGGKPQYGPLRLELGAYTFRPPLVALLLLGNGPYYCLTTAITSSSECEQALLLEVGLPAGLWARSASQEQFVGLRQQIGITPHLTFEPFATLSHNGASGRLTLSRYGCGLRNELVDTLWLYMEYSFNDHDLISTQVKHLGQGSALSFGLEF